MYSKKTSLLIGFHGCDKKIQDAVINGAELKPSKNNYDWLGHGIYFWEADPVRALEWAEQLAANPKSSVKTPAVIGAVIDLGNCLDLTNRASVKMIQAGYKALKENCELYNKKMPKNRDINNNSDLLLRELDCAVIQSVHNIVSTKTGLGLLPYDSVRGVFSEGSPAYEGAGFLEKTHTQLCIINPNCIKGYFLPRKLDESFPEP